MKFADIDDNWDALHYQLELMNPFFGVYQFGTDPTVENLAKAAYLPGMFGLTGLTLYKVLGETFGVRHAITSGMHWGRQGVNRTSMWMLRQGGMAAVRSSPVVVPAAIAVAGAVTYEKRVNESLKKAHGGAGRNVWFGPFASGFGSVV